jgi:hypothetical protein
VLEGAQGALLDPAAGFRPYVTKTDATMRWAGLLLAEARRRLEAAGSPAAGFGVRWVGVARAYGHRHGAGPLVTELPADAAAAAGYAEVHNQHSRWQGDFRAGHCDLPCLAYGARVAVNAARPGLRVAPMPGAEAAETELAAGSLWLSLTHLDRVGADAGGVFRLCTSYAYVGGAAPAAVERCFETEGVTMPDGRWCAVGDGAPSPLAAAAAAAAVGLARLEWVPPVWADGAGRPLRQVLGIRYPPPAGPGRREGTAHYDCRREGDEGGLSELLADCVPCEWLLLSGAGAAAAATAAIEAVTGATALLASYGPRASDKRLVRPLP